MLLPDVAGNRLFQSYQNMDDNPHVGLLFMIPGLNDTVRINGTITIVDREELERQKVALSLYWTDDNAKHLQGIIINVEESYTHCPRAYNFAKLWDTEQITANRSRPAHTAQAVNRWLHPTGDTAPSPIWRGVFRRFNPPKDV